MPQEIKTIRLSLPLHLGSVNCYLVRAGDGYVLIDTGSPRHRTGLEKELESAGCQPGNLKLIVVTHGDFDHAGNCAYLRKRFGTRIAMHADDSGMVERGDMFWNTLIAYLLLGTIDLEFAMFGDFDVNFLAPFVLGLLLLTVFTGFASDIQRQSLSPGIVTTNGSVRTERP